MNADFTADDVRGLLAHGDMTKTLMLSVQTAVTECARRRTLVLAQPDLAARLCATPMFCARPEHWSGFIPPALANGAANTSPIRTALLAIVAEAEQRTQPSHHLTA